MTSNSNAKAASVTYVESEPKQPIDKKELAVCIRALREKGMSWDELAKQTNRTVRWLKQVIAEN